MIKLFEHPVYRKMEEPTPLCWKVLATTVAIAALLAMTVVCASCEEQEYIDEEQVATLRIEVRNPEMPDVTTRTTNPTVTIKNLHILIYDSNHELLNKAYSTSSTISVETRSGSGYTIYAIANTGEATLFDGRAVVKEEDLKKKIQTITTWNQLSLNNIVLTGSKTGVTVEPGTQTLSGGITVALTAAEINLNIGIKENSGIKINDYTIYNIPQCSYYVPHSLTTENKEDDTGDTGSNDATNGNAAYYFQSSKFSVSGNTSASQTFYMFENRRGVRTGITTQQNKISTNAPGCATYVKINGTMNNVTVQWQVYLGANNTTNFNIKRNCKYTYNITLNDAATADSRVTIDFAKVIDLSEGGIANCYLTSQTNTWYKFKATVRGNGAATTAEMSPTGSDLSQNATIDPKNAELVWETDGHQKIVQGIMLKDGYVWFKTGTSTEGNAVIAVKDGSNKILWSWHIWKTSFDLAGLNNSHTHNYQTSPRDVGESYPIVQRTLVMMDRNLGAASNVASQEDDVVETFGLYYQFGRKDPFPSAKDRKWITKTPAETITVYDKDGKALTTTDLSTETYLNYGKETINGNDGTLNYAIENPLTFICCNKATAQNWINDGAYVGTPQWKTSNKLWGGNLIDGVDSLSLATTFSGKTIYDPCPAGWCIPPQDTWTNFTAPIHNYNTNYEWNCPSEDQKKWNMAKDEISYMDAAVFGRRFYISGKSGTTAFYPANGYRNYTGHIYSLGVTCWAWASTSYHSKTTDGAALGVGDEWICPVGNSARGNALPVRCVKEESVKW